MMYDTTPPPRAGLRLAATAGRLILTQAELDQLVAELDSLRSAHRERLAERLRHARGSGVAGDNDDQLAAFEDAVVDEVRIAQLERLIASATVIDGARAGDGAAGLGSIVRVAEGDGRRVEYEIVGVRTAGALRSQVTPGSPIGQALLGARVGDTLRVTLPNGRERSLQVLALVAADDRAPMAERRIA
jgi:transcription elongation factor GreA